MLVHSDNGVTRLFRRARVHHTKAGIEEGLRGLLERDSVFSEVLSGLRLIPDEADSIQLELIVYWTRLEWRMYIVNMLRFLALQGERSARRD